MADDIYRKIGKAVREARDAKCMSQQQVADLIGVGRSSVANIEAGRQGFTFETLAALVQVLGIDPAPLIALVEVPDEPIPHNVTVKPVLEVRCGTCVSLIGRTPERAEAQQMKAAHIEKMQERARG